MLSWMQVQFGWRRATLIPPSAPWGEGLDLAQDVPVQAETHRTSGSVAGDWRLHGGVYWAVSVTQKHLVILRKVRHRGQGYWKQSQMLVLMHCPVQEQCWITSSVCSCQTWVTPPATTCQFFSYWLCTCSRHHFQRWCVKVKCRWAGVAALPSRLAHSHLGCELPLLHCNAAVFWGLFP